MRVKKLGFIFSILILVIFSLTFASAANECVIKARSECTGGQYPILGLSSPDNTHGEIYSSTIYPYVLCCNFGNGIQTNECNSGTKILKLSSTTNAHAEIPSGTSYSTDVCYQSTGFSCQTITSGSCPTNYNAILSLSATTNAHIGGPNSYSTKICCNVAVPLIAEAYWSGSQSGSEIHEIIAVLDDTESDVYLIGKNLRVANGQTVNIKIYEKDLGFWPDNDDLIKTLTATVSSGSIATSWTVTQADLDKTGESKPGGPDTFDDFYFEIINILGTVIATSNDLTLTIDREIIEKCLTIDFCSDYKEQVMCDADSCSIADKSIKTVDCSNPDIACSCWWDIITSTCGDSWSKVTGYCQDGKLQESKEQCDPDAGTPVFLTGESTCEELTQNKDMDSFTGGTLGCFGDCRFDTTQCIGGAPYCGDNVINIFGEDCDGTNLNGNTCKKLGYDGGTLSCNSQCSLDKSGCIIPPETASYCGDGNIDTPNSGNRNEYCDGANLGGITTCTGLNSAIYQSGNLECSSTCTYDVSNCVFKPGIIATCGDGVLNQISEECDNGYYYNGNTCESLGYSGGILGCVSCEIDGSQCEVPAAASGTCQVTQDTADDCSDGYLSFTWTGVWIGDETSEEKAACEAGGYTTQTCPALVQLPFFGTYSLIGIIILALIIYLIISLRKKSSVNRKGKNHRKRK